MLSGGDYTKGLAKIGPTAALELIAEFIQTQELEVVNPPNSSNILTPNDSHLNKVLKFYSLILAIVGQGPIVL